MAKYASKVVAQAKAWLGLKESDGSYKVILDTYNSQAELPRGHKMNTSDAWCAAPVSAVAVKLGYTDIIPTECSCGKMIEKLKAIGSWVEKDDYVPAPGDLCFYDWEAPATGENTGAPDHVGIVENVFRSTTGTSVVLAFPSTIRKLVPTRSRLGRMPQSQMATGSLNGEQTEFGDRSARL